MDLARSVRVIQPTISRNMPGITPIHARRRVAAYARVSTDNEEQQTSYAAQVDYYTKYINERPDYEFVGIYTDEGISAVNTKKRDGFNRMVNDALAGKIDLIVTKSVSRFARNTVDSLSTVRKLKEHGTEVFFEKEAIYTFDGKGELLITIMSSLAQEESRSISENVTWGHRKRFADGKLILPYKRFLGYERGEDCMPQIVEQEAEIVRLIFRMYINGKTYSAIAKWLTDKGIPTPGGKRIWQTKTIHSILTNEKYKGEALLQKGFTVDFLTKQRKVNEGEIPQYYVKNSHPAIIAPDEFDVVQIEIERRTKLGRPTSCNSPFSAKIVCGECGGYYGAKVWGSNTKYRRTIWRCNEKYKGEHRCATRHVTEDEIKAQFLISINELMGNRDEVIANCQLARDVLSDCSEIDDKIDELRREIDVIAGQSRKMISENAHVALSQDEFNERNNEYLKRHRISLERISELEGVKRERMNRVTVIDGFIRELNTRPLVIDEFDERLWLAAVERVTVGVDGGIMFGWRG